MLPFFKAVIPAVPHLGTVDEAPSKPSSKEVAPEVFINNNNEVVPLHHHLPGGHVRVDNCRCGVEGIGQKQNFNRISGGYQIDQVRGPQTSNIPVKLYSNFVDDLNWKINFL